MRNVFKGYQVSKMAVPKLHEAKINQGFAKMHAPPMARQVKMPKETVARRAPPVGKWK
jgi:hypothetical protein